MAEILLVGMMASRGMKLAAAQATTLPVYHSLNVDGPSNKELQTKYEDRVKHLCP